MGTEIAGPLRKHLALHHKFEIGKCEKMAGYCDAASKDLNEKMARGELGKYPRGERHARCGDPSAGLGGKTIEP